MHDIAEPLLRTGEKRYEGGDDPAVDVPADTTEKIIDALAGWHSGIVNDYAEAKCGIHVHFRTRLGEDVTPDLCARFQLRSPEPSLLRFGGGKKLSDKLGAGCGYVDIPVLVDLIKTVEGHEGVSGSIPSVVRLQSLDRCNSLHAHGHQSRDEFEKLPVTAEDRKCEVSLFRRGQSALSRQSELVSENVQSRLHIRKKVSDDRSSGSWRILDRLNPVDVITAIALKFAFPGAVVLGCVEGFDFRLNRFAMELRPSDLEI